VLFGLGFAALVALDVGLPKPVAYLTIDAADILSTAAVFWAVRRYRPSTPGVWYVLAASMPAFVLGGVLLQALQGMRVPYPGLAALPQGLFLCGYLALLAGVVWADRCMNAGMKESSLLDTAIVLVAAGGALWVLLMEPLLASSRLSGVTRVATALYPGLDVALIVVIIHVFLANPRRPWALWGIVASVTASIAPDMAQAILALKGEAWTGLPLALGWVCAPALLGMAVLHPSMRAVTEPGPACPHDLGGMRSLALWTALLICPVSVVFSTTALRLPFRPADLLVPTILVTTMVFVRLRWLFLEKGRSEAELASREHRFKRLLENQSDHVLVVLPDGSVTYQSPSTTTILGYGAEELIGNTIYRLIPLSDGLGDIMNACLDQPGVSVHGRVSAADAEGHLRLFEATLTDLSGDSSVGGVVLVLHDVTDRERFEEQLRHQALHDSLTGIANRALVLDRADRLLTAARRAQHPVVAVFVDLDNVKDINDSLGHLAGDELLVSVAGRLLRAVREADTVGRLGGDEFVVLFDGASVGGAPELVAERIADVLAAPVEIGGHQYPVTASIGVATTCDGSAEDLIRNADIAMYRAKTSGKNRFVVFQPQMQAAAHDRLQLEIDLRTALHEEQFCVFYQPAVDVGDLTVGGVEALVRWNHPSRGLLLPGEFIPLAEENGLIVDIGRWVLQAACTAAASWTAVGAVLTVSVNVSPRQLESAGLLADVQAALRDSGLHPPHLGRKSPTHFQPGGLRVGPCARLRCCGRYTNGHATASIVTL